MSKAISYDTWVLTHMDGTPACTGEMLESHRGEQYRITGGRPPHKPSSTGRVWVEGGGEFFPTVFNLKWVDTFVPTPPPDNVPRTPASQAMYLDDSGTRCPFCGSDAVYAGNTHLRKGGLDQEINCGECQTTWYDQYTLTGYTTTTPE